MQEMWLEKSVDRWAEGAKAPAPQIFVKTKEKICWSFEFIERNQLWKSYEPNMYVFTCMHIWICQPPDIEKVIYTPASWINLYGYTSHHACIDMAH